MKKKYYYLHIWAISYGFDELTVFSNYSEDKVDYDNFGLDFHSFPADDFFLVAAPYCCVTDSLKSAIDNSHLSGIRFKKIRRIKKNENVVKELNLDSIYWLVLFDGKPGIDDFGLYQEKYLVVSHLALNCVRENSVTHAESDELLVPIDDYFNSKAKYFWMAAKFQDYFYEMELKNRQ